MLAGILALEALAGLFLVSRRAKPVPPEDPVQTLLKDVAAHPESDIYRIALVQYCLHQHLTFGVAAELDLASYNIRPELKVAAAQSYDSLGLPERALVIYRKLNTLHPDPGVMTQIIALDRELGDFPAALADTNAAIARYTGSPEFEKERMRSLLDVCDYKDVIRLATAALYKDPEAPEPRIDLAWAYLLDGKCGEAAALLQGLPDKPIDPWAEVLLGRALLGTGRQTDIVGAKRAFSLASIASKDLYEANVGVAEAYAREKNWDQALSFAQHASEQRPDSPLPWQILVQAYRGLHRESGAQWCLGHAALISADVPTALRLLSVSLTNDQTPERLKDLADANLAVNRASVTYSLLQRAADQGAQPDVLRFWYNAAYDTKDFRESLIPAQRMAQDSRPRVAAEGYALKAQTLLKLRDLAGAKTAMAEALSRSPNDPALLAEHAQILLTENEATQDVDSAMADLNGAAAQHPNNPPVYFYRALADVDRNQPWQAYVDVQEDLTQLHNVGLEGPLSLISHVSGQLGLKKEAQFYASWTSGLRRASDAYQTAVGRPASQQRDETLGSASLLMHSLSPARGAYLRLTRAAPKNGSFWLKLAMACQQLGLYDERVAAMEHWRKLQPQPDQMAKE